jgi:hypothetical protein
MKFAEAKKKLPTFARGLLWDIPKDASDSHKLATLRNRVKAELASYRAGENPLPPSHADKLYTFLLSTQQ